MTTPTFEALKAAYPTMTKEALFDQLGGQWPDLKDDKNYNNTCAVRLSVALRGAGVAIPDKYKEAIEGDGSPLILKVSVMGNFVKERFGQSYWGMSKEEGTEIGPGYLPSVSGIIVYHGNWSHATGHFDLWTGKAFVGTGNFVDIADGFNLELWRIE